MAINDVVKAITVTAELTGASLSGAAVAMMASDLLSTHGEDSILRALTRCRKELSRPLTAGAVFDRLADDDGRPSSDEAWAIALQATDEADTVVWNQEIQRALSAARPILEVGDKVGARMAFRESYDRSVRLNRESGVAPQWSASLGWDQQRRTAALESAQSLGLLSGPQVAALLPHIGAGAIGDAIFNGKALPAPMPDDVSKRVRLLLESMADRSVAMEKEAADRNQAERDALTKRKHEIAVQVEQAKRERSA